MRLPPEALDSAIPLTGLGLDSLMASELQVAIQGGTGTRLSVLELMKGNSIATLAQRLLAGEPATSAPVGVVVTEAAAAVDPVADLEDVEMGEL
jgi:acyl carrier protein